MNYVQPSTLKAVASLTPAEPAMRPLKAVKCLLPVWGHRFVRQFLDLGLPTWLAPGNLPALAAAVPTEFVVLTSREDEFYLRSHPGFRRLTKTCDVAIHYIDHLITGNNYSTTITLAYGEAVRSTGAEMTDTCFLFLVSDYIVADGSFATVLNKIQSGFNGVQVGNFQVIQEDAMPWLIDQLGRVPGVLSLSSRDTLRWALSYLHAATVANTINFPFNHNNHTNRLFWRVDNETLIGRFFLMHMIAIRPERLDFVIGASCDYSFIPEMCPSDNVTIITDSDDYLVIEMQPRDHEADMLKPGPQKTTVLAATLSEWTTARHRKNAKSTVVFHAGPLPDTLARTTAEADTFVLDVEKKLVPKPRPHRRHPYWTGAIAAFKEASGAKLKNDEWRLSLGLPNPDLDRNFVRKWAFERLRFMLFGRPPHVRPVHPRFPDYLYVVKKLKALGLGEESRLLLVSDTPSIFTAGLIDGGERVVRIRASHLLRQSPEVFDSLIGTFDGCLIEVAEGELFDFHDLIDRVAPLLKNDGCVLISLSCRDPANMASRFKRTVAKHANSFVRPYVHAVVFNFVSAGYLRWQAQAAMMTIVRAARRVPILGVPALIVFGPILGLICAVGNRMVEVTQGRPPEGGMSSVLVEMRINSELAQTAHMFSATRILRARQRSRLGYPEGYRVPPRPSVGRAHDVDFILTGAGDAVAELSAIHGNINRITGQPTMQQLTAEGTKEPQYNRCLEIKQSQGLTSLGLMTNQVWEDDPRRLTFLLARYKFVSKMLSGKKFVGELGCGDAFGTRVVLQEVEKLVAYDFDPVFVDDIRERWSKTWPVEAHVHDIVEKKLPNQHDGIYSLDVIEHISRADEGAYLANLRESLTDNGVLIIGTPSLESQTYASPPSKAGHINCKSGSELKALLLNYFENVFLFSMNDEVVHTGFSPMAHYLFAVCCQKKV